MNLDQLPYYPNVLLVTGNGKNVGKTTLSCRIIENNKQRADLVCVKISTHFHEFYEDDKVLEQNERFILIEELKRGTGKDSSQMLDAGAKRVFFLMVKDDHLPEAFARLQAELEDTNVAMIIESAALRKVLKPCLFTMILRFDRKKIITPLKPLESYVNHFIEFTGEDFDFDAKRILLEKEGWKIH
jgi:hypothetical protein